jgi:hypothetical protein
MKAYKGEGNLPCSNNKKRFKLEKISIVSIVLLFSFFIFLFVTMWNALSIDTQFMIKKEITPTYSFPDNNRYILLQYNLGDCLILDEFTVRPSVYDYIKENTPSLKIEIYVEMVHISSHSNYRPEIKYYLKSNQITSSKPILYNDLIKHIDSIPEVIWKMKNGNKILEQKQNVKEKRL